MKRKYKGYAQSIGFDPIQAPDTTRRMAEQDNRMIRGMEAQRAANRQNREVVSEGMSRANQLEAGNREQNYQFNKQNRQRVQEDQLRNRRTLIEDANRQAAAQVNQLEPLAKFSETLSKTITGYEEARSEAAMMEAYNEVMMNGLPEETAQQTQAVIGAIDAQDEQIQRVADGLQARGVGPEIIFGVRSIGRSAEIGRMKAMMQLSGAEYGPWLEEQFLSDNKTQIQIAEGQVITPMDAVDPVQKAAVRDVLRKKFLQEKGLFGIQPAMLADTLGQMREMEARMAAQDRQVYAQVQSDQRKQDADIRFQAEITTNPGTAVNNWLRDVARTLDSDGRSAIGLPRAMAMLQEKLLKAPPGTVTEATISAIEATAPFNQPDATYGKQFPWFFQELRRDMEDDYIRESQREEAGKEVQQREFLDNLREQIKGGDFTADQLRAVAQKFEDEFGSVPAELYRYIDSYGQLPGLNMTTRDLEQEFERKAQAGTLTLAEIDDPRVPRTLSNKYRGEALRIQKQFESSDTTKRAKESISAALRAKLAPFSKVYGAGFMSMSSTFVYAEARALQEYQKNYLSLSAGARTPQELQDAEIKAMQLVRDQITSNNPSSPYYVPDITKLDVQNDVPEFKNILAQLNGDPTVAQRANARSSQMIKGINEAIIASGSNPRVLDTHLLIPATVLTETAANYRAGNFTIPPIVQFIADRFQGRVSPTEIIQRQLGAHKITDQDVTEPLASQVARTLDPRLQRLFNFSQSRTRSYRAALSAPDFTPFLRLIASKESEGYGGYDAMNIPKTYDPYNSRSRLGRGLSQMTIGEVMERQANGEVYAAGKYQIIASTLQGLMNGSYGKLPFKPTDRFDASAQDQMAMALAKFRLKQGGANPVNLRKVFRDEWHGFKKIPDAQLDAAIANLRAAATSPYRTPDTMSARLVYHIGNRGYGSNGPHKHVGSVDGKFFDRKSLDQFIEIEMNGKRVPLSTAMTVAGGEFGASRDGGRRKHTGWDYAAPDGTPVYLKGGAKVVSNSVDNSARGGGSHNMIIQTPDGRQFIFHHGTAAKGIG